MANPNPTSGRDTRIKPGERRNPTGKQGPRLKKLLDQQADQLLATAKGDRVTRAEAICTVAWRLALEGNLDAIRFIFDRLDGKVTDKIQMAGLEGGPLVIEYVNDWRRLDDGVD